MNRSIALVFYKKNGDPIAYVICDKYDDELISKLQEAFKAEENAETEIIWCEPH